MATSMLGDDPTHEIVRPLPPRDRFREIAEDVKSTALAVGSVVWLAAGAVALVGFARIVEIVW